MLRSQWYVMINLSSWDPSLLQGFFMQHRFCYFGEITSYDQKVTLLLKTFSPCYSKWIHIWGQIERDFSTWTHFYGCPSWCRMISAALLSQFVQHFDLAEYVCCVALWCRRTSAALLCSWLIWRISKQWSRSASRDKSFPSCCTRHLVCFVSVVRYHWCFTASANLPLRGAGNSCD